MESFLSRGIITSQNQQQNMKMINFSNIPDNIRVNYAEIVLKSRLTECLEVLSKAVFDSYKIKLDLINIVDNIARNINLSNFINMPSDDNYIGIFGNMIYNELYRMIIYLRTLYDSIHYDDILISIDKVKIGISQDILYILGKIANK